MSGRYIHNRDEDVQPLGTTTAALNFPLTDVVRKNGPGDAGRRFVQIRVGMFNVFDIVQYSGRNLATNIDRPDARRCSAGISASTTPRAIRE